MVELIRHHMSCRFANKTITDVEGNVEEISLKISGVCLRINYPENSIFRLKTSSYVVLPSAQDFDLPRLRQTACKNTHHLQINVNKQIGSANLEWYDRDMILVVGCQHMLQRKDN